MDQRIENVSYQLRWLTWKRVLAAIVVVLVVLEVGTYAFNWTWTGFKDNDTVWDWLQLLEAKAYAEHLGVFSRVFYFLRDTPACSLPKHMIYFEQDKHLLFVSYP